MLTRRDLLARGAALGSSSAALLSGLGSGCQLAAFACTDERQVPEADRQTRRTLAYQDRAGKVERECRRCHLYTEPQGASCGGCRLFAGPVHPLGTCNAFSQRT